MKTGLETFGKTPKKRNALWFDEECMQSVDDAREARKLGVDEGGEQREEQMRVAKRSL